jgi:hypothetical protein
MACYGTFFELMKSGPCDELSGWRIFAAMSDDPDVEYLTVDSTAVRAHQHAAGAKKIL